MFRVLISLIAVPLTFGHGDAHEDPKELYRQWPSESDNSIRFIKPDDFDRDVEGAKVKICLIFFGDRYDRFSRRLSPTWKELQNLVDEQHWDSSQFLMAKVDCRDYPAWCKQKGVDVLAYPSVFLYRIGSFAEKFEGENTAETMFDYIKENLLVLDTNVLMKEALEESEERDDTILNNVSMRPNRTSNALSKEAVNLLGEIKSTREIQSKGKSSKVPVKEIAAPRSQKEQKIQEDRESLQLRNASNSKSRSRDKLDELQFPPAIARPGIERENLKKAQVTQIIHRPVLPDEIQHAPKVNAETTLKQNKGDSANIILEKPLPPEVAKAPPAEILEHEQAPNLPPQKSADSSLELYLIVASVVVKLPQIYKIYSRSSADGVSFESYAYESASDAASIFNEFWHSNDCLNWKGSNLISNAIILAMSLNYRRENSSPIDVTAIFVFVGVIVSVVISTLFSWKAAVILAAALDIYSKAKQIQVNALSRSYGNTSVLTTVFQFAFSCFVAASQLDYGSAALNIILCYQIYAYRGRRSRKSKSLLD